MLTCQEAEKLVMPYIHYELDEEQLEQFLNHIETCPECKEELEIYYTVSAGLKQLDSGTGIYDIAGNLEDSLDAAWLLIRAVRLRRIVSYAVSTLWAAALVTALLLQLRIWMESGIMR